VLPHCDASIASITVLVGVDSADLHFWCWVQELKIFRPYLIKLGDRISWISVRRGCCEFSHTNTGAEITTVTWSKRRR
jgi:hypothetical protein